MHCFGIVAKLQQFAGEILTFKFNSFSKCSEKDCLSKKYRTRKDGIHPRKYDISSDRKIKDDKKVYFYKKVSMILCTFMEIFIGVFKYCFFNKKKTKKNRKLNISEI